MACRLAEPAAVCCSMRPTRSGKALSVASRLAGPLAHRPLPTGRLAHIHLNDRNRRAPGQGSDRFAVASSSAATSWCRQAARWS